MSVDETSGNLSIGCILLRMKVIRRRDLEKVVRIQAGMSVEELLGELLVARGLILRENLESALKVQRDLRSGKRHAQALAVAEIAETSGRNVLKLAERTQVETAATRRRVTGDHPSVAARMIGVAIAVAKEE